MTDQEENLKAEAVLYYSSNLTPISRTSVIDMANSIVDAQRETKINFMGLSLVCLDGFIKLHENLNVLHFKAWMQVTQMLTPPNISSNISQKSMLQYPDTIFHTLNLLLILRGLMFRLKT